MKLNRIAIKASAFTAVYTAAAVLSMNCFAASDGNVNFSTVTNPIINLINSLLGPALGIVVAVGALFCVVLGVKYAKAEEPQEREKARSHLTNAIIGFILIFVLIAAMKALLPIMEDYAGVQVVNSAAASASSASSK